MKVYRAKLGTQPAMLQFVTAYKFRTGLSVIYRRVELTSRSKHWQPAGKWQSGIVRGVEPVIFVEMF